jgi:hypothetical protein
MFHELAKYGDDKYITDSVDGINYAVYILTIGRDNIKSFQEDLLIVF